MADTKKIDLTISNLERQFGNNCVVMLGRCPAVKVDVIPTGVLSIDKALGVGGFPRGRIVEVYGPESGGKTTLALQVIAQAQAMGGAAGFVDAEHALDPKYATALGVNVPALYFSQPNCGEDALQIVEGLVSSGEFDIIVVDSVAALVPRAELEGEMGQAQMGLQARLMSQAMRKLTGVVCRTKTCLVFINQIREKIGQMYGNPETTTGGRALKFYASMRIDVRKSSILKDGDTAIGVVTKIKLVKNKVAAPLTEAEPELYYGKGFSQIADLINLGSECGVINKSGSWYDYAGERLGQGKENAIGTLTSNPALAQKIFMEVRSKIFPVEEKQ